MTRALQVSAIILFVGALLLGFRPVDPVIDGVVPREAMLCGSAWFPEYPQITANGVALCQGQGLPSAVMATGLVVLGGMCILAMIMLCAVDNAVARRVHGQV